MEISVIIVNYNTRDLLKNCLESVYQTVHDLSHEIIVVDNASIDDSVTMLRREFPDIVLIQNKLNLGFGKANNQALGIMKGRYALLLNSDTVLTDNAVSELHHFMENHPQAAIACGQLLNADGSKQNSIANFPSFFTLVMNTPVLEYLFPGLYPGKRYEYKEPIEIDSGVGACLIVRKDAIDKVGRFDERYFFFFEETDWALQMKSAGFKIYFVPSARIYHFQGQSIGRDVTSRIEFYRSRYLFFKKWKSLPRYYVLALAIFIRLVVNWMLTSVANIVLLGANRKIRDKWIIYSRLILWHLKGRPGRLA